MIPLPPETETLPSVIYSVVYKSHVNITLSNDLVHQHKWECGHVPLGWQASGRTKADCANLETSIGEEHKPFFPEVGIHTPVEIFQDKYAAWPLAGEKTSTEQVGRKTHLHKTTMAAFTWRWTLDSGATGKQGVGAEDQVEFSEDSHTGQEAIFAGVWKECGWQKGFCGK